MKLNCDKCGKPATVHLTEITNGQKAEKHLCEDCAVSEGITIKANVPISQLLEDFILQGSSEEGEGGGDHVCEICGLRFSEFRKKGLLGCSHDYDAFAQSLDPLLERTHEGATQHVGKVPRRAGTDQKKMTSLLRLRAQLKSAVTAENYEQAAELRDHIKEMEKA